VWGGSVGRSLARRVWQLSNFTFKTHQIPKNIKFLKTSKIPINFFSSPHSLIWQLSNFTFGTLTTCCHR
jgi:hypothetical protein